MAPWPTVKMRRLKEPRIAWRPEWRVGPDADDPPLHGPQKGLRGGVLSWAAESGAFECGEGFEVSLRSGPGPHEEAGRTSHGFMKQEEAPPDRDEDDFVLSFRRADGAWQMTAGKRSRLAGLVSKRVQDRTERLGRCSFWVACVESLADGKHYVLVGKIPGILIEHFFVGKVARSDPLSHAGFSYLPTPAHAVFGDSAEGRPVVLESITMYPHGLTGELPLVSTRFVEQVIVGDGPQGEADGAAVALARAEFLSAAAKPRAGGDDEKPRRLELRVRRGAAPGAPGAPGAEAQSAAWCNEARLEVGVGAAETPADAEAKRQRRAKRACTLPTIDRNALEAPASWAPQDAQMPEFGAFDDTLRHDPSKWGAEAA